MHAAGRLPATASIAGTLSPGSDGTGGKLTTGNGGTPSIGR